MDTVSQYTKQGMRVIACAYKHMDAESSFLRDECEKNLQFLGLVVFVNKVKKGTRSVVDELNGNNFKSVIVSGDHVLTAISVGKECNIIAANDKVLLADVTSSKDLQWKDVDSGEIITTPQLLSAKPSHVALAITGNAFDAFLEFNNETLHKLLLRSKVFARMNPTQKTQLVDRYMSMEYVVGMVCFNSRQMSNIAIGW